MALREVGAHAPLSQHPTCKALGCHEGQGSQGPKLPTMNAFILQVASLWEGQTFLQGLGEAGGRQSCLGIPDLADPQAPGGLGGWLLLPPQGGLVDRDGDVPISP